MSNYTQPAAPKPETVGALMLRVADEIRTVNLFIASEEDNGVTRPVFVVSAVRHDGTRTAATRHCLVAAISAVLDQDPPGKRCRICKRHKEATAYSHSRTANTRDGRLPRCKECERVRVGRYREVRSPMQPHQLN